MSSLSPTRFSPQQWRRLKLTAFLVTASVLVGLLFAALQRTEFFQRSEWRLFDVWTNMSVAQHPLAEGIAVIDIDDTSLSSVKSDPEFNEAQRQWPWPRDMYADLLIYLYACGAKEVVVDLLFYETRQRSQDEKLRLTAEALPSIKFALNQYNINEATGKPHDVLYQPNFPVGMREQDLEYDVARRTPQTRHLLSWSGNYNQLTHGTKEKPAVLPRITAYQAIKRGRAILVEALAGDAPASTYEQRKQIMDDWLGWESPEEVRKVLDAWLARRAAETAVPGGPLPVPAPGTISPIPFPLPGSDLLRGKVVVIGSSADASFDLKKFPVSGAYLDPGMLVHITRISNERQNSFFRETSPGQQSVFICLVCFAIGIVLSSTRNVYAQISLGVVGVIVTLGVSYLLFSNLIWLPPVTAAAGVIATSTSGLAIYYVLEGRQRQLVSSLFGSFVSESVLQKLMDNPEMMKQLGGDRMNCTIMFSDLSGFTDLTEHLTQREQAGLLVDILNDYFTQMSAFVINSDGYVDKYIGDALMAVYGVPNPTTDHATRACFAALDCVARMQEFAPKIEAEYGVKLYARYGINTGDAVVGLMGSLRKINYTVIGDPVNLASRLEGANKPFGTTIMIGEETYALAKDDIEVRPIANLIVKGKLTAVRTYELMARKGGLTEEQAHARQLYWAAFDAFGRREWDASEAGLRETIRLLGGDSLSEAYLKSIAYYRKNPPPSGWQGIIKLDEK